MKAESELYLSSSKLFEFGHSQCDVKCPKGWCKLNEGDKGRLDADTHTAANEPTQTTTPSELWTTVHFLFQER